MYYFFKLVPPRPTFALDLTPDEAAAMQAHAGYWRGLMDEGQVVVFGLVGDPAGPFGVGIANLPEGVDAHAVGAADPAIQANVGLRYEIHPMPLATAQGIGGG